MNLVDLHQSPQFIPVLAKWYQGQWGYLHPGRTMDELIEEIKIRPNKKGLPFIYVLEENGQAIGTASLLAQDMPDLDKVALMTPWLASVFVDDEHRQQGHGERLIKAIEQKAAELGFNKMYLFTPDKELWYQKHGWLVFDKTTYHNEHVTIMEKRLR